MLRPTHRQDPGDNIGHQVILENHKQAPLIRLEEVPVPRPHIEPCNAEGQRRDAIYVRQVNQTPACPPIGKSVNFTQD
jgi:hypothetical protein